MTELDPENLTNARTPTTIIAAAVRTVNRWRDRGDRGRLAELRRLERNAVPSEAFWAVADAAQADHATERFLREFLPLVATVRHRTQRGLGGSFRGAGIAPARFERWLRQPRDEAVLDARRLVRRSDTLDLIRLGTALYYWTDTTRLELAREFYRQPRAAALPATDSSSTTELIHG